MDEIIGMWIAALAILFFGVVVLAFGVIRVETGLDKIADTISVGTRCAADSGADAGGSVAGEGRH